MNCKAFEKRISEYLDGSLEDQERHDFEAHRDACTTCKAEFEAFHTILIKAQSLDQAHAPDSLWRSIEAELDASSPSLYSTARDQIAEVLRRFAATLRVPEPAFKLAGVLAVLLIGVMLGRYFLPITNENQQAEVRTPPSPEIQMVASRADKFVEKSKILFLGFVNADTSDLQESEWSTEKKVAQTLVQEAADLKDDLSELRSQRLKFLIEELELILLEIANLEKEYDAENIELIKSGIDRKGLLLKIHLHDLDDKPDLQQKEPTTHTSRKSRV